MSYLVRRENFADGTPPPKPIEDNTPPPKKPYSAFEFKDTADTFLQGIYGTSSKNYFIDLIQQELDKGVKEGVITMQEGLEFIKDRKKYYDDYLKDKSKTTDEPVGLPRSNFRGGGMDMGNQSNQDQSANMGNSGNTGGTGNDNSNDNSNDYTGSDYGFVVSQPTKTTTPSSTNDDVIDVPPALKIPITFPNRTPDLLNSRISLGVPFTKNLGLNFSFDPKSLLSKYDEDIYGSALQGELSYNKGGLNAGLGINQFGDPYAGLSFRKEFSGGTDPKTGQGFQKGNTFGVKENLIEANREIIEAKNKRVLRTKELIMDGDTPAEAKKKVIKEFNLNRDPKAGTPRWLKQAKEELTNEGFKFKTSKPGPENVGGKEKAIKKREQVIGKGTPFETRIKREKTKTGFGKKFETAHTANIFQAKALGMDYPVDALATQLKDINQETAEILNEELKPLYKKQIELRNKLKKNNTYALRKELDDINFKISETVATGGKQGSKAANVLKPIIVDPQNLKGKILDLGFDTSTEVMTAPGATTKGTKAGSIDDLMARMNIKEKVIQKASEIDRPESAKLRDAFKKFGKYAKVIAKPVVRAVSPFIPFAGAVGVGLGAADVAEASTFTKKPDELGIAYLAGPEVAKNYGEFKESVRGKSDEFEEFVP